LGLAFRKAGVDVKTSTIMLTIQGVMNPFGVGILITHLKGSGGFSQIRV